MGKLAAVLKSLDAIRQRAKEQGYDSGWFHGSTHDIERFGGGAHNSEGHFGAGHYLTSSADDAGRHYAGEGPDLTNRITQRAEQIAGENDWDYDDVRAVTQAKAELKGGNEGVIYPIRTRTENAFDISSDGDSFLSAELPEVDPADYLDEAGGDMDLAQELADEARYEYEPEGPLVDFIQSLQNNPQVEEITDLQSQLSEYIYDGGISGSRLDEIMRNTEWYAEGPTGGLENNEAYRQALQDAGFDSVVHDADIFTGMDVEPGTKHKIVFDPERLRSPNAAFDPDKADSANLLAGLGATAIGAKTIGKAAAGLGTGYAAVAPQQAEASFLGVAARNADEFTLGLAQKMKAAGRSIEEIWQKTGWGEGADGKWRFEVDDSGARLEGNVPNKSYDGDVYRSGAVGDALRHDELDGAGYGLDGVNLTEGSKMGASYSQPSKYSDESIALWDGYYGSDGRVMPAGKSPLLHELQHAIQEREGFARGGSPEEFGQQDDAKLAQEALSWSREVRKMRETMPDADISAVENAVTKAYHDAGMSDWLPSREAMDLGGQPYMLFPEHYPDGKRDAEELVSLYGLDRKTTPSSNDELYKRLAGEVEARNVQKRMDMTPEQRRNTHPIETEDVPRDDQIVRYGSGESMYIRPVEGRSDLVNDDGIVRKRQPGDHAAQMEGYRQSLEADRARLAEGERILGDFDPGRDNTHGMLKEFPTEFDMSPEARMARGKGQAVDLDISPEARMARAQEQGFDTDTTYYHGTSGNDIDGFNTDVVYASKSPKVAANEGGFLDPDDFSGILSDDQIADSNAKFNTSVYPLYLRGAIAGKGDVKEALQATGAGSKSDPRVINYLRDRGFSGAADSNYEVISFDPANIRSVNAKFDPANRHNPNLLGSADPALLAGTGVSSAAIMEAMRADHNGRLDTFRAKRERRRNGGSNLPREYREQRELKALGNALEMPSRGLYGLGRAAYGAATGEANPLMQGADVARQTQEESATQFGDYIMDNTNSPAAATAGYTAANFFGPI